MYSSNNIDDINQVYNFVKCCLSKDRIEYWKKLSPEEISNIVSIVKPEVVKAFLEPEKYPKLVEKYGNEKNLAKLELVENYKECGSDAFLYNRLMNFYKYESTHDLTSLQQYFKEKEEVFFSLPIAVPDRSLRPLKSTKNYAAKIYELLKNQQQTVFFELKSTAFGCYFYTPFLENIFFPLDKMNLIPSFVTWRNEHLVEWFIDSVKTRETRAYKKFQERLLIEEIKDAERELNRSFYEEYEDKVRNLFEMKTEFKLIMVQHTVDLTPDSVNCVKQIILVRYQDFRSTLKPEVQFSICCDNFEEEFNNFKSRLFREKK